jgi:hypothetical protein
MSSTLAGAAGPAPAGPQLTPWVLPAGVPSAQPHLVQRDGRVYLSWIESRAGEHRLRYAIDGGAGFGKPREVARGRDWFVNWADFPALAVLDDGSLAAHLLVKRSDAPYAYDVRLLRSPDGAAWSQAGLVHDDATATEHGFVSLWPAANGGLGVAWLDGRETGGGHGHEHGGGGAMTLRGAAFDTAGKRSDARLDASTCDCCQTDVAIAARGPVLVYRDRSADEIRDIAIVRLRDGRWSPPRPVHADGWRMPACPVNGPAVAAAGDDVVVAWYTAAAGEPEIRLARSADDGVHFGDPVTVARGVAVQGRVDLAMDASAVYLSWLDEDTDGQVLRLARFARHGAVEPERVEVAALPRGRGTGFPRLALRDGVVHAAWTDIVGGVPRVRGARIRFPAK